MSLKPLYGAPTARRFSAYDLEWNPDTYELRLCGIYDERGYRCYTTVEQFLDAECTLENSGRWFYAHAGGLYDFQFLLQHLVERRYSGVRVSAIFSGSSAIIVEVTKGKHTWYFLDSFWLLRQSLKKIGAWMGLVKGGDETGDIFHAPLSELKAYNEQDCLILYRAIQTFESVLLKLGGRLEKTVAASALGLFRRAFLKETIRTCEALNQQARKSYVASRVEVIERTCDRASYWDINSSFPHAMTFESPGNYLGASKRLSDKGLYIADVDISVPESYLPPLPYRDESGRVFFPHGRWRAWLTSIDVELLQATGGMIERVREVRRYAPFTSLREYAIQIYELRISNDNEAWRQILKILLNALYGKFGESSEKERFWMNPPLEFFVEVPANMRREVSPGIWLAKEDIHVPHAHVPIASFITARARRSLYNYMGGAKRVYYCDTDGFSCEPEAEFAGGKELGALKLEKIVDRGIFAAPKLYAMHHAPDCPCGECKDSKLEDGWAIRAKGFSRVKGEGVKSRALRYSDFCELLEHKEIAIDRFVRIREGLRGGAVNPRGFIQNKTWRNRVRPKRAFDENGGSRPWHVSELECKG